MHRTRLSILFASLVVGLSLIAGLGIGGILKSPASACPAGKCGRVSYQPDH